MTEEPIEREAFLRAAVEHSRAINAGKMPVGSVTALIENLAQAVLLLAESSPEKIL